VAGEVGADHLEAVFEEPFRRSGHLLHPAGKRLTFGGELGDGRRERGTLVGQLAAALRGLRLHLSENILGEPPVGDGLAELVDDKLLDGPGRERADVTLVLAPLVSGT